MPLRILQGPVIDAGQAESQVLDIGDDFIVGLITPENWTPAVASISVSADGDNFFNLFDASGAEVLFNVTPGTMLIIDPNRLLCASFLKLRSGTRDTPVVQDVTRRFYTVGSTKATVADTRKG